MSTIQQAQQAMAVVKYLKGLDNTRNVRWNVLPVLVTIQGQQFVGAQYDEVQREQWNEQKTPYLHRHLWLIGLLPKCRLMRKSTCFTYEGQDWYVACHSGQELRRNGRPYQEVIAPGTKTGGAQVDNPFGNMYLLLPWQSEHSQPAYQGQTIDHYEKHKYVRVPMTVDVISLPDDNRAAWSVIVGNIGTVCADVDEQTARKDFSTYLLQSMSNYGRAAGESVSLWYDNEPVQEYQGTVEQQEA